jgi:FixJ family two-component response regulator
MLAAPAHIYIVDDDPSFGRSLRRLLNARGVSADHFESAKAFLDSVPPDRKEGIVFVDIRMPDCDGFALMDEMHARGYRMPVIVITAHARNDTHKIAMKRGAAGFLEKPFNERLLLDLIESLNRGLKRRKFSGVRISD